MWKNIETPTLIIDEQRVKDNIQRMLTKAQKNDCIFRPHFKTHQSIGIGKWFRDLGVDKIAVSSLVMAEYFSTNDWDDILVAFPVNIREIKRINHLSARINLGLLVENVEGASFLLKHLKHPVDVWLKVDTGYHRTGLTATDSLKMEEIFQIIAHSENMIMKGIVSHSGHTYSADSIDEIEQIHDETIRQLIHLKQSLQDRYPEFKISVGDTPSCSISDNFDSVDEIRPGVFTFYDWMQYKLQACKLKEIALAIALPIVAKHKERNEIVVSGGAVHLSKDKLMLENGGDFFGQVVLLDSWAIVPNTYMKKMSQEHGIIHLPNDLWENYQVGDLIGLIPVHACLTADNHAFYLTKSGERIMKLH